VLQQLTWKWLPNATVSAALSRQVREECAASTELESCFLGLRALFATGAQTPDLAPVLVSLSQRDPDVRANWRSTGYLLERGEPAHRYRSMFLDMLGLLGPQAADAAAPELVARLGDAEERSRWAAAGALRRVDPAGTRPEAARFFAKNVTALIGSYHVDRKRRLRACLFLVRAEVKDPAVQALALDALGDENPGVRSCAAFLVLTSGFAPAAAEDNLLGAFEAFPNQFARDSIVAALGALGTPRARQLIDTYTPWQPERVRKITERWNDPYFRLFDDLL
jgi:HEAT repeat protein